MRTADNGTFTVISQDGESRAVIESTSYVDLAGQLQTFSSYRFTTGGRLHMRSESVFACESTGQLWKRT